MNGRSLALVLTIVIIAIIAVASLLSYQHRGVGKQPYESVTSPVTETRTQTLSSTTTSAMSNKSTKFGVEMILINASVSCSGWEVKEILTYNLGVFQQNVLGVQAERLKANISKTINNYGGKLVNFTFRIVGNDLYIFYKVSGFVWRSGSQCYADSSWLIRPLGLDLIDNHFVETTSSLEWRGELNGIKVTLIISLPPQEVPYKAWQEPVGHCHAHIWWPVGSSQTSAS
jgi:hypothetical protein